jgi:hypothetical protein
MTININSVDQKVNQQLELDFTTTTKNLIKQEIKDSGIDPAIAKVNLEFLPDVSYDPVVREATDTPLDNVLGRKFSRFTHEVNQRVGLGFKQGYQIDNGKNDSFDFWQVKVFFEKSNNNKKSGQYLAPSKIGNRVFFPNVPDSIIEIIEEKYNVIFDKNINFWENILLNKSIPIEVTEGGKKVLSLLSQGIVAISIYGCTCLQSTDLIPFIKDRTVNLTLDRDPLSSKGYKSVQNSIYKIIETAKKYKTDLKVRIWDNSLGKGIDDLIVNSKKQGYSWEEKTRLLSPKEYKKLTQKEENNKKKETIKQGIKKFYRYTSHKTIKTDYLNHRLIHDLIKSDLESKEYKYIFNIKSGLGSNKSGSIIDFIKTYYDSYRYKILWLSDINNLLYQTKKRFNSGLPYLEMRHLGKDKAYDEVKEDSFILTCCINSLLRFIKTDFSNCIVVIDEVVSVFQTLINGDTFQGNKEYNSSEIQQLIYQILSRLLREAKHIFLLDGNLNNHLINAIQDISNREVIKIEAIPESPKKFDFTMIYDFSQQFSMMYDCCLTNTRFSCTMDSKVELRKQIKLLTDSGIDKNKFIIVDEDSTKQEAPKEFLQNPTQYLIDHPEIIGLFYSPSMNRGFDISGDIFAYQFCWFKNVLGIDQIDQQIFRVRSEQTKRFVTITNDVQKIERKNKFSSNQSVNLVEQLMIIKKSNKPLGVKTEEIDKLLTLHNDHPLTAYEKKLDEFDKLTRGKFLPLTFQLFMIGKGYEVKEGLSSIDLEIVKESEKRYYDLNYSDYETDRKVIKEEIEQERQERLDENANCVSIAPNSLDELEQLKKDDPVKYENVNYKHITAKNSLENRLPGFTNSKSFTKENIKPFLDTRKVSKGKGLYSQIYRLTCVFKNHLSLEKTKRLTNLIINDFRENGLVWINSFDKESNVIQALINIGITEFLDEFYHGNKNFTHDHYAIKKLLINLGKNENDRNLLDFPDKVTETTLIKEVSKLVQLVGFTVIEAKKVKGNREYKLVPTTSLTFDPVKKKNIVTQESVQNGYSLINDLMVSFEKKIKFYQDQENNPDQEKSTQNNFSQDSSTTDTKKENDQETVKSLAIPEFNKGADHLIYYKKVHDLPPEQKYYSQGKQGKNPPADTPQNENKNFNFEIENNPYFTPTIETKNNLLNLLSNFERLLYEKNESLPAKVAIVKGCRYLTESVLTFYKKLGKEKTKVFKDLFKDYLNLFEKSDQLNNGCLWVWVKNLTVYLRDLDNPSKYSVLNR